MGDINRSSPQNDNYDHSSASTTPSAPPVSWADKIKGLIGINTAPKEPVSSAPGYEGKTPAQIADEMSK